MKIIMMLLIAMVVAVGSSFMVIDWNFATFVRNADEASNEASKDVSGGIPDRGGKSISGVENPLRPADENQTLGFDVANVERDGTSVFAGRAPANSMVTVTADGEAIGTAQSDSNGEWVLVLNRPFTNSTPRLSIKVGVPPVTKVEPDPKKAAPASTASDVTAPLIVELERRVEHARAKATQRLERQQLVIPVPQRTASMTAGRQDAPGEKRTTAEQQSETIPVPIKFVFREATMTDEGRKAAQLLLDYALLEKLPFLSLTGHADERGTREFNFRLSEERLSTVSRFLRQGGYSGGLELIPKGDTKPFSGVNRSVFSRHQLYDLDRRVELHLGR